MLGQMMGDEDFGVVSIGGHAFSDINSVFVWR
jgi:hypothetical protein